MSFFFRIFVTNSLSFLPECDEILLLENGRVTLNGHYNQLIKNSPTFTKFISSYFQTFDENDQNANEPSQHQQQQQTNGDTSANKSSTIRQRATESLIKKPNDDDEEFKIIETEKITSGNVKLKRLIDFFRANSFLMVLINFLTYTFFHVTVAVNNWWLSDWSDNAESEHTNSARKLERLLVFIGFGVLASLFSFVNEMFLSPRMLLTSSKHLHNAMLHSIMRSRISFFESTPVGRILNRFSKDINSVEFQLPMSYKDFTYCSLEVIAILVVISVSTPWSLLAFTPLTIIYILIQRLYVASCSKLKRLDSASKSPIYSHFGETLTGISTIRAYNAQARFIGIIEQRVDENNQFAYPTVACNLWLGMRLQFIGALVVLAACVFAVIGRDTVSAGVVGMSLSYALNMSLMLNHLVKMTAEFESNLTSVERIGEYCSEETHEAEWRIEGKKPGKEWPAQGRIEFVDYSLRYREDLDYALRNVTCVIEAREKVGIVGRTGAGKSSLSLGLFRILEIKDGDILIDGVNIREIGLHDLRQSLTIIPQDPVIFSGTLRVNLDPLEVYSDDQIWEALEKSNLKVSLNQQLMVLFHGHRKMEFF